jgi:hypothetical protein
MQRARNTSEQRCRIFGGYRSGWRRVDSSHGALKTTQRRCIALDIGRKKPGTRKDEKHIDKGRQRALRFATLPSASSLLGVGLQIKGQHERKRGLTCVRLPSRVAAMTSNKDVAACRESLF